MSFGLSRSSGSTSAMFSPATLVAYNWRISHLFGNAVFGEVGECEEGAYKTPGRTCGSTKTKPPCLIGRPLRMATGHAPTRHLLISLPICVTSSNTTVRNSGNARNRLRVQCFFHQPFPAFSFSLHSISSLSSLRIREIVDIWGGIDVTRVAQPDDALKTNDLVRICDSASAIRRDGGFGLGVC
ncbi:hypothetical protein FIBSPDRAFT_226426 [Athelia psychrophila]|uniref:Uncharacterized protein n=1 Tax=Athelia psychrophila TaxID=1759441 RepID=A0A166S9F0_9AGAM|nr:hypothetical protein FIBSPDRAFT_226426 [Fibularhizoctonia sp. CBS 109695]